LKEELKKIPSDETVTKALEIQSEDEIKDYIEKYPSDLEENLKIIQREYPTSTGPMDFLAKDKNGVDTVIEVKMKADDITVTQIRRYMRAHKQEKGIDKIKGIIVAEEFTSRFSEEMAELVGHGYGLR
jgi:RecB family endonuclease NucS